MNTQLPAESSRTPILAASGAGVDTLRVPPRRSVDTSIRFEQYKLAVEMAAGISARRQAANAFFIGLVSSLGAFYSLVDKALPNSTGSARGRFSLSCRSVGV